MSDLLRAAKWGEIIHMIAGLDLEEFVKLRAHLSVDPHHFESSGDRIVLRIVSAGGGCVSISNEDRVVCLSVGDTLNVRFLRTGSDES